MARAVKGNTYTNAKPGRLEELLFPLKPSSWANTLTTKAKVNMDMVLVGK